MGGAVVRLGWRTNAAAPRGAVGRGERCTQEEDGSEVRWSSRCWSRSPRSSWRAAARTTTTRAAARRRAAARARRRSRRPPPRRTSRRRSRPSRRARAARHADQGRRPVGLPGRLRLVRQPGPGGVVAAFSQFAGAKPKNPNKPRDGMTGGAIGDHPIKIVGIGCSDDRADTAIKETRRLMEQLGADVMIGPLSGDESIAVANYAKQHPDQDVRRRLRGRAGHDAQGAGPELLPLQRGRRAVERRPGRHRLQPARVADGGGGLRRLQLRLDVDRGLHRRVLRRGRPGRPSGSSRR